MAEQPDFTATVPRVTDYTNGDKHVRFVALQPIALGDFYRSAQTIVKNAQLAGGVHYYEFIDLYRLSDADQRKIRKLSRFMPMPDAYAIVARILGDQLGLDLEALHPGDLVGLVDDTDINADISPQELLRRVEALTGPIALSQEDLDTPILEPVAEGIPEDRWKAAMIDSRVRDLAARVHAAQHRLIVISYSSIVEPGWIAEMQRLDSRWRRYAR
ncbi:MAG: hypothetical protein U0869_18900 [Chloroflexota bacterium]